MTLKEANYLRGIYVVAPFSDSGHILITDYETIKKSSADSDLYKQYIEILKER